MSSVLSSIHFHNEEAAYAFIEALLWPDGPICPHCGNLDQKRIGRLKGKTNRIGLRKCYACREAFTVKIGTIFEDSHAPLRLWLQAVHLMCSSKKGISTRQLQRTLRIGMKTAWFMGMRVREMMKRYDGAPPVGGEGETIEADVTYVGRKPGTKVRRGFSHMNPVLALVERGGEARSFHMPNVTAQVLPAVLREQGDRRSHLRTDEARDFTDPGRRYASHETVKHSADEYVRGDVHTNTVEGFFSILKRGVYGIYQHVSEAHLQRYLTEFDFRYSQREKLGIDDVQRAAIAIQGAAGRRLTYETTRADGARQRAKFERIRRHRDRAPEPQLQFPFMKKVRPGFLPALPVAILNGANQLRERK